jgi:alpha-glucosidase
MHIRYSLLPYMYTLFHQAHTTGSTVMRALAWEFPNDPTLASADRQFLLGPSLMVTPVLEPGATTVNGVFPGVGKGTVWYDWYSQKVFNAKAGQNMTIAAPLSHIPLFVRGGSILPMQAPGYTTEASRKNPWTLLAALDTEGSATGSIYLDDGESVSPKATKSVSLTIADSALYATSIGTYADGNALANVTIMGVPKKPNSVTLNGKALPASNIKYNTTSKVLAVTGLRNATAGGVWAVDWSLAWSC